MRRLKKIIYWVLGIAAVLAACVLILGRGGPAKKPYVLGVTFRYMYAQSLGLNWKQTYLDMFNDFHVTNVRIPAYWDVIEKTKEKYDFSDLDYQVQEAQAHKANFILAIGRRVPGWPECHVPSWANSLAEQQRQQALMDEMKQVVLRYKDNPNLTYWQVENEPFLTTFGLCPNYAVAADLDSEIAMVRKLDPNHKIMVTDGGEYSVWVAAARRGDVFGSTFYKKVYTDFFHSYITYHLPPIFYRFKEGVIHLFWPGKPIINIELQAEPWTTQGIADTSFKDQSITLPPGQMTENLNLAHESGFSVTYFWGVEYWYWAAQHGHPEFLNEAKQLFKENQNANTGN